MRSAPSGTKIIENWKRYFHFGGQDEEEGLQVENLRGRVTK